MQRIVELNGVLAFGDDVVERALAATRRDFSATQASKYRSRIGMALRTLRRFPRLGLARRGLSPEHLLVPFVAKDGTAVT